MWRLARIPHSQVDHVLPILAFLMQQGIDPCQHILRQAINPLGELNAKRLELFRVGGGWGVGIRGSRAVGHERLSGYVAQLPLIFNILMEGESRKRKWPDLI